MGRYKECIPWNRGKRYSNGHRNGGYYAIHKWLVKYFGNANKCENRDCLHYSNYFQWALKKGHKHEHRRENYFMLCPICHRLYDENKDWKAFISKKILQIDKGANKIVKTWNSFGEIARHLNKNGGKSNISKVCKGERASAYGWRWQYANSQSCIIKTAL